ncbi:Alpha-xylosidase [Leucoagaricus sp. SymC.cos]|nr:Alpha-xylosidase [Leucoagaricus sp. SymC.cos]
MAQITSFFLTPILTKLHSTFVVHLWAVVFARSAMAGCQRFPVHWGGDPMSTYEAMVETLRGSLSLGTSGFGYWVYDIGGFEGKLDPGLYKGWFAFGSLSSHSRLHGSGSYRVPWIIDTSGSCDPILRHFISLKLSLMPYLYGAAISTHRTGTPMMRPLFFEFPEDRTSWTIDEAYMLGINLYVAPVFSDSDLDPMGSGGYSPAGSSFAPEASGKKTEAKVLAWEMASQAPANNPPNAPNPFAPLQQLVSWIDSESRAQDVIDQAQELSAEDRQLLLDVLSMTLNKTKILSQRHAHVWFALIKIASSAHIFARNRTVRSEYMVTGSEASACVKVVRQTQDHTSAICHEKLVEWAHLSHPNILPLYAVFLESKDHPSFVSPSKSTVKICDHARSLVNDQHLPLILDVINGLCHLHQLNIVHGGLGPGAVLVLDKGRALITDLDIPSEEEDSNALLARYSAPELSLEDDSRPMKATDVWAFGCLGHEVLSGKAPFCQFSSDFKAISAIGRGDKPARPGHNGRGGSAISDAIWDWLMMCWEYEDADRPTSSKLQEILSYMHVEDHHPEPKSIIGPKAIKSSITNLELAKAVLSQILDSHEPASLQVPKHLCDTLSRLIRDSKALDAAKAAAKKLNRDDTQILVDLIELVMKDLPHLPASNLAGQLLRDIIDSTHIFSQYYRASSIQYDPTRLVSEYFWGKLYEGRVLKVRVYITYPNHTLISDVANGLAYLQNVVGYDSIFILVTKGVVISDEGQALIVSFGADHTLFENYELYGTYYNCFWKSLSSYMEGGIILSFGCLSYQVLSRKLPYYQVTDEQVANKVRNGDERLIWPDCTDAEMDEIDDKAWELITKCCAQEPKDQPDWSQIQEMLVNMEIEEDHRPTAMPLPIPEVQVLRSRPEVDIDHAEIALNQAEVLHGPLSELIENHTKDVAMVVAEFEHDEIQAIVNFLDQALKERLTIAEEQNRVLAILSRITSSTLIFPQRFELTRIKHDLRKFIDEGGCGTVYQAADPTICIKMMKQLGTGALMIKEVILWAHSSHPNVLPFLGVFLEGQDPPRPCLISPFMKNGNLKTYAAQRPQKSRLPLILDVINGLQYLHGLGVVHGDLKRQNVLISVKGHSLITNFGTSHINTATAASGKLSSTTLYFTTPKAILGNKKPTKEFDIWSLGCLFYETLSRKSPYYQYKLEAQIINALNNKELPKRPGTDDDDVEEEDEYDWPDHDYDTIDDQAWSLILKCCVPEPEARLDIASV